MNDNALSTNGRSKGTGTNSVNWYEEPRGVAMRLGAWRNGKRGTTRVVGEMLCGKRGFGVKGACS